MGGAECSTAGNPLSQFTKHVQDDKSLQRDRLVGRPGGNMQGMRSTGGMNMSGSQDNVSQSSNYCFATMPPAQDTMLTSLLIDDERLHATKRPDPGPRSICNAARYAPYPTDESWLYIAWIERMGPRVSTGSGSGEDGECFSGSQRNGFHAGRLCTISADARSCTDGESYDGTK